jgi:secreted Zn-dependent insulinase-like peptidase
LRRYPTQEVLHGPYAMKQYSPELIKRFLDHLIPHNVLMMVVARELPTDSVEPWFNAPYQITALAEKTLQSWQTDRINPLLALPKPNAFIPDDLAVKPLRQENQQPELIAADEGFTLWYKQDDSFQLPRSDFYVSLRSPIANSTPENAILSELYVELVKDQLNEFAYSARLGGLKFKLYRHLMGLSFIISGYHDKQYQLLARIVTTLRYPAFDIERFEQVKADINRRLKNVGQERPYRQVLNELTGLLMQNQWNQEQQLVALQSMKIEDVRRFVSMLFKKIDLISLAHGNIYQEEALSFASLLKKVLLSHSRPVLVRRSQVIKLANGKNLVRQLNIDHDDSAIAVYFQGADTSFASRAQFSLLAHIIASPFFQELRTERQLGYVVFSSKLSLLEVPGIVFSVQSPTANPVSLEEHI